MPTMTTTPLAADPATDRDALKRGASEYADLLHRMQELGLLKRRHGYYLAKIALLIGLLAAVWVGFSFLGHHWAQLGIAAALAVILTQIVFLSHDAAHRQIFANGKHNDLVALVLGTGIGGISLAWWNNKHSKHHKAPNQVDADPDIDPSIVHFYLSEKPIQNKVLLAMHARQGWWFFPILMFEALNLHVQSVISLATQKSMKRRKLELAMLIVRHAAVPALVFVFLPVWMAVAFLGVMFAVMGVYLGASFAVSHIGMPVLARNSRVGFLHRQVVGSRNILGGRIASGAMGGLNFQIEHHLFPSMPRPNLRKARPVVQAYCAQNEIAYHEVPVHKAWLIVVRYLNKVGLAGRDAYGCPTASILR